MSQVGYYSKCTVAGALTEDKTYNFILTATNQIIHNIIDILLTVSTQVAVSQMLKEPMLKNHILL